MNFDFSKQIGKKIAVCEKTRTTLIGIDTITHLICDCYVTTLYHTDQEPISSSKLLKHFEVELNEFGFLRVNNNTIINPNHISGIEFSCQRKILHINHSEIKVSRRRAYLFKKFQK